MKKLFLFIFVVLTYSVIGQNQSIDEVRRMYFEDWQGKCGAEDLDRMLGDSNLENDPVLMAYKAAAKTTLANCKTTPLSKLSVFREGKDLLEKAVVSAPGNVEVRFIRFTVQTNIPGFLGYNNMEADKKFILDNLNLQQQSEMDSDLKNRITEYFIQSEDVTAEEKSVLVNSMSGG
ncbi:MAG: hypothetical protein JW731_04445 [Bacteroidales bacterium]|nr:hypothetical protein [Bacteroidales bacterium]